jgi:hypothetical protein
MWCWRRIEKIIWTDRVRNEEVLQGVKEERNIVHTIKRRKANWIGHILRRNWLLKHVTEGKLEGRTGRRGRRRKQLLDDLKEKRRYWKLKEEALDRTLWRTRFGRGYGPVVRQTTEWMNIESDERCCRGGEEALVACVWRKNVWKSRKMLISDKTWNANR